MNIAYRFRIYPTEEQKRLRPKEQDFLEKTKKDWRGSNESCQDAYEEVIIMNCRKRKLLDVMKRYEISERLSAQT